MSELVNELLIWCGMGVVVCVIALLIDWDD